MKNLFVKLEGKSISYLFLFIMAVVFSLTSCCNDPDLLWHIKIGEEIIKTHTLSMADSFSWQSGLIWYQQEWLFDCFIYLVTLPFAGALFEVLYVLNNTLILYLGMVYAKAKNKILYFCISFYAFAFIPANHSNRPIEFSVWIIFGLLWIYVGKFPLLSKAGLLLLGGILLSNFHGGMIVPFVGILLALILVEVFLLWQKKTNIVVIRNYFLSLSAFMLGIMICPSGIALYRHLFVYIGSDTTSLITEWAPWQPGGMGMIIIMVVLLSIGFHVRCESVPAADYRRIGIILAVMAITFLYGAKGGTLLIFAVNYLSYPYIEALFEHYFGKKVVSGYGYFTIMGIAVAYFFMFSTDICESYFEKMNNYLPHKVISLLKDELDKENGDICIYNDYLMGNFLLWNDIPCFVDSRQVPYTKEFSEAGSVDDLFTLYTAAFDVTVFNQFFDKYEFDFILESKEFYLKDYLLIRNDYMLLYDDGEIRLWRHSDP